MLDAKHISLNQFTSLKCSLQVSPLSSTSLCPLTEPNKLFSTPHLTPGFFTSLSNNFILVWVGSWGREISLEMEGWVGRMCQLKVWIITLSGEVGEQSVNQWSGSEEWRMARDVGHHWHCTIPVRVCQVESSGHDIVINIAINNTDNNPLHSMLSYTPIHSSLSPCQHCTALHPGGSSANMIKWAAANSATQ